MPARLPGSLELAEELVAQPKQRANNLPRLLAGLKGGNEEVRGRLQGLLASAMCKRPPPPPPPLILPARRCS